ncbi:hypothetical protein AN958_04722 [Leucoagaricus sp. SymC.cos]|nr:hypothetical protein AN958_04722 [Leucoagaricus sp. SymC.cos]
MLHLLSRITKSSQIFPSSLELTGVRCDLSCAKNEGGFGCIYQGELKGQTVCVKAVRPFQTRDNKQALRAHAAEFTLWSHICHPNVLPFCGVYLSDESLPRICIVSPWMELGSLASFLKLFPGESRHDKLSDIISGLQHLHELEIVHSDLKANNVLVSLTRRAVLADFGASIISTITPGTTTRADFTGTPNWMAPELLTADVIPPPTLASDMWAFGCTCYEVLAPVLMLTFMSNSSAVKVMTSEIPFAECRGIVGLLHAFAERRATPSRPDEVNTDLELVWPLLERCWDYNSERRPSADEAKQIFDDLNIEDDRPPADEDDGMQLLASLREERKLKSDTITIDYGCVHTVLLKVQSIYRETLKNGKALNCTCQCHGSP